MKLKFIFKALAVALTAIAQPVLAEFTHDANGNPTHYNGIPIPPMQTVAEARSATKKRLAAIHAEEAQQAAQAATELATRNPSPATAPQELFFTGKPYLEGNGQYLFLFRHYDPELARWTTADPSGFTDGANNIAYMAVPTAEIDWQGLTVKNVFHGHWKTTFTFDFQTPHYPSWAVTKGYYTLQGPLNGAPTGLVGGGSSWQ
jgi:RHS repeat-associated protein